MLRSLRCEEFVIVAEAEIDFGPGLNVITGETGTGKSLLIDAIGFLAGGRADIGWIREGAPGLAVEGSFEIDRLPAAVAIASDLGAGTEEGILRVRREIGVNGRAKAWAGGRVIRIGDLRCLGEQLIAIHGQGDHRRLLDPAVQLMLLDRFAGAVPLRERYASRRERWRDLAAERAASLARLSELSEKEEWHRFQHDEIAEAHLDAAEEEALREKRDAASMRRHAEETRGEIERILFEEEGSAAERIETALHRIGNASEGEWGEIRAEIDRAREALRRARRALPLSHGESRDEEDLDAIEERLARIARLKKKYGGSIEKVLERRAALASLLDETERLRAGCATSERDLDSAAAETAEAGIALHKKRGEIGPSFSRAVTRELRDLGMAGAHLDVVLDEDRCTADDPDALRLDGGIVRARPDGIDRGWFRLRPNPGEGAGPIGEIASGGELSRALLGIVAVLGAADEPRTAIFDEVDAGVGGGTATAVARRLNRIARDRQVLLVTHLPLVACRAARHFRVDKKERAGRTIAAVVPLDREGRIGELARMLAGEGGSAIARRHAVELMESAAGDAL